MKPEKSVRSLLARAGINIFLKNSGNCRAHDIMLLTPRPADWFRRVYADPFLGFPESYIAGEWECQNLVLALNKVLTSGLADFFGLPWFLRFRLSTLYLKKLWETWFMNKAKQQPFHIGHAHYDKGNELFIAMLDETMTYSCGLWGDGAQTLREAQLAKFERAARDLKLEYGMHVLDIGCGFGSFAKYIAEHHGAEVVGLTVSQEQAKLAQVRCANLPIDIRLQDYSTLDEAESFDAVCSFGMFEHVTPKNYPTFFSIAAHCLKPGGRFFLHSIASYRKVYVPDPFINKWIFPNGYIPTYRQTRRPAKKYFTEVNKYEVGPENYAQTLEQWLMNFRDGWQHGLKKHYEHGELSAESFYRLWELYLSACIALFQAKQKYVLQLVLERRAW